MLHLVVVAEDVALAQLADETFAAAGTAVARPVFLGQPVAGDAAVAILTVPPGMSTEQVERRSWELGRRLSERAPDVRYCVLIDSALCGPIDALVGGLMYGLSRDALLCPADRMRGRTIVGGLLHQDALPIPERPSLLGELIGEYASPGHVRAVSAETARQNGDALRQEVEQRFRDGAGIVVVDADATECLANVARLWWLDRARAILVGSQALLQEVVAQLSRLCPSQ
jgi:uncharacterized protein YgbK (DUF1537 family)